MFTPLRDFYYAGYMITLIPHRQADGRWGCRYSIIMEGLKAKLNSKEGGVEADFMTSLAAEIAALKAAKGQIDSWV
ncbi:MAG: hypothetical protein NDI90_19545 [Nitrospira sp. BO4]|jgi:hypothetical protein|nr:hypothetical protein [Nitrospira sp. BO4]